MPWAVVAHGDAPLCKSCMAPMILLHSMWACEPCQTFTFAHSSPARVRQAARADQT